MSASSQHPQENQKGESERDRAEGWRLGGGLEIQEDRKFVCVKEGREKGNEREKEMEMEKRGKKITRIHPVPLCGDFIRLRE